MRRIALGLLALVGAVVVLAAGLIAFAQTNWGRALLADALGTLLSGGGATVVVGPIRGTVPTDLVIERASIADRDGVWATVERARLTWSPLALVRGRIAVDLVDVARVTLHRRPVAEPSRSPAPNGGLPTMPRLRVDRVSVADVVLAAPILGTAARLSITGAAQALDSERGVSLALDVRRSDRAGRAHVDARFTRASGALSVSIELDEPAGGLAARLAGMPGLPAIKVAFRGDGTLDDWRAQLAVSANGEPRVEGAARVRRKANVRDATFEITADIASLVPPAFAAALAGRTVLQGRARIDETETVTIERLDLRTAAVEFRAAGRVDTAARRIALRFEGRALDSARLAPLLPLEMRWAAAGVSGSLEGALARPALQAQLEAERIVAAGNRAQRIEVKLVLRPEGSTPAGVRRYAVDTEGHVDGAEPADARMARAIGPTIRWSVAGLVDESLQAEISSLTISSPAFEGSFSGRASPSGLAGNLALSRVDLAAFSDLAGQPLGGMASLTAEVDAATDLGRLSVRLRAAVPGIATGVAPLDRVLGGRLEISGGLRRAPDGSFAFDALAVEGASGRLTANGSATPSAADVTVRLSLPDLARVDQRLTGRAAVTGRLSGSLDRPAFSGTAEVLSATALGRRIDRLLLAVEASGALDHPSGTLKVEGSVGGKPVTGSGRLVTLASGARRLESTEIAIGSVVLRAQGTIGSDRVVVGSATLKAGDLGDLAPLLLSEAAGRIDGSISFDLTPEGKQRVRIDAIAERVSLAAAALRRGRIRAEAIDPLGAIAVTGEAELAGARAGSDVLDTVKIAATADGEGTRLRLDAAAMGAVLDAVARASGTWQTLTVRAERLQFSRNRQAIRLAAPATLRFGAEGVALENVRLVANGGTIAVNGRIGEAAALRVALRNFPLAAAALAAPQVRLAGRLSGEVQISGPPARPSIRYDLAAERLSSPDLAAQGLGPLALKARGTVADRRLRIDATITGRAIAGIALSGVVPLGPGEGLDLAAKGRLDLAVANTTLATRGATVSGPVALDIRVQGSARAPRLSGSVQLRDGRFDDPVNGFLLQGIEAALSLSGSTLTITRLSARARNGGTIVGDGRIEVDPDGGFPARISLRAQNALVVANQTVNATADGRLDITGPLLRRPKISGRITVRNLDIGVPDAMPRGVDPVAVRHVNPPPSLKARLARRPRPPQRAPAANGFIAELDLFISAPVRVFVRGRGIESEMGGDLAIKGTSAAPTLSGGFELKRGRLDLLGKRLSFTRGKVTFPGELDPELDFVAESKSEDVDAKITVSGRASAPKFAFTSTPELPQEEILARLFFGRPASRLTTGQAVQLAQAAADLSGTGGPGLFDRLRRSLGVDSLDVRVDERTNQPGVGIGRRISDRVYLGVRQGATPESSRTTVDIDITRHLKVQGEAGTDGSSSIGIGAEWDY